MYLESSFFYLLEMRQCLLMAGRKFEECKRTFNHLFGELSTAHCTAFSAMETLYFATFKALYRRIVSISPVIDVKLYIMKFAYFD